MIEQMTSQTLEENRTDCLFVEMMSERHLPNSKTALKYRGFTNKTLDVLVLQRWEQLPVLSPVMTLPYNEALPS